MNGRLTGFVDLNFELESCKFEELDFVSLTFCYFISVMKLKLIHFGSKIQQDQNCERIYESPFYIMKRYNV